jgi:carbonic anhydrase
LQKSQTDNKGLSKMLSGLEKIKNTGDTAHLPWTAMRWMKDALEFFKYRYYSGSLTSSPCSENVTWIISEKILALSSAQVCSLCSQSA